MIRTFVALPVPPEVQGSVRRVVARLQPAAADLKIGWTDPDSLHLTLSFLGEVEAREIPAICQCLRGVCAPLPPFDLEIVGCGAFPDPERPRTVWVGAGRGSEAVIELQGRIEAGLAPLGFRPENRRFRPHLTIGRVRSIRGPTGAFATAIAREATFAAGTLDVTEVLVYSSELQRGGPEYLVLGRAELVGPRETDDPADTPPQ